MKFSLHSIILTLCASVLGTSLQLRADTITVTNNDDSGPGSLRAAIIAAAATSGSDTINFAPALNGETIALTTGELSISGIQITIDASALLAGIKISGNSNFRIFSIDSSNVTLKSLDLFNGKAINDSGGGISAISCQLICDNVTIRNSASTYNGGGLSAINVTGSIDRSSFIGNESGFGLGGGIYFSGTTPSLTNSVISGNRSNEVGGGGLGILNTNPAITNCTIQGNWGNGIQLEQSAAPTLRNTIVWGNRSGTGSIASQQILKGGSSTAQADVDFCMVEGVASTLNNLNGTLPPANYPLFVNPAAPVNSSSPPSTSSDLRVFINSPVLNVGSNVSNFTSLDRAGKARVQNTTIDLGAFEGSYVTFGLLHAGLNPLDDSNGNGISNFSEYASGIDPTSPDNPAARPSISQDAGFNYLTTSHRSNAVDVVFSWETSTSLQTLSWQEMVWGTHYTVESTNTPSPSRQENKFKLLGSDPRRFYRQVFRSN